MSLALRIAVTALLVVAMLWWVGDDEASGLERIGAVLSGADLGWVAILFLVSTFDRMLMVFKWKLLLGSRGIGLGFLTGMRVYCTSLLWGLFLPSTVGADAVRAGLTVRAGLPGSEVLASIVVERLVGFLTSLIMGLAGLLILSSVTDLTGPWASLWWMGSLLLLAATAVVGLSFSGALFDRIFGRLPERIRERGLVQRLQRLHATYVGYGSDRRSMAVFAGLTLAENGVSILISWTSALALHIDVSLLFIAGALPLTLLVSRLPISLDGIGVFEGVFAGLLLMAGVPEQEAISLALLARLVQIASWVPWWVSQSIGTGELRPSASLPLASDGEPTPEA